MNATLVKTLYKKWDIIFVAVFSMVYLYWVILGNLQLLNHPYAWEPDEIDDIDSISRLFDATVQGDFYEEVIEKDFHGVHGLITLYLPGLFGVIPKVFFGDAGMLFSLRMMGFLFLMIAYLIYSFAFFKSKVLRISVFLFFMAMPFTGMFATWPRCESYQYFFMALFFLLQFRSGYRSNISYIFLGMALISRISTVIFLPLAFLSPFFIKPIAWKNYLKKIVLFWLGCTLSNPYLLVPSHIVNFINRKLFLVYEDTGVKGWIDVNHWMTEVIKTYFGSPYLFYLFVVFVVLVGIVVKFYTKEVVRFNKLYWYLFSIISLGGVFLIAFEVKMDTYWYLQFSLCSMFFCLAVFVSLMEREQIKLMISCVMLIFSLTVYGYSLTEEGFIEIKLRAERDESFQVRLEDYQKTISALDKLCHFVGGKKIKVRILAEQFQLKSDRCYEIEPFWSPGPFAKMDGSIDVIVFDYQQYRPSSSFNDVRDGDWPVKKESVENFKKLVSTANGGDCQKNCFVGHRISKRLFLFSRDLL